jgi:acyl carrier protein
MDDLLAPFLETLAPHLPSVGDARDIPLDAPLRELGLNSLRAVDLLIDLEDRFSIAFPDEALTDENFANAKSLMALLERHLVADASGVDGV